MVSYPPTVVHMNNGAGDRNVNWVVATFSLASKRRAQTISTTFQLMVMVVSDFLVSP